MPKNRFISFVPSHSGVLTAIVIYLDSMHHPTTPSNSPDFTGFERDFRWVNTFKDASGNPVLTCPDSANFGTTFKCATLGCSPEYRDWGADLNGAVLHVSGAEIVPSSRYNVHLLGGFCFPVWANYSPGIAVETALWGDVVGPSNGPPDDTVNVLDLSGVVDKIKDIAGSMYEPRIWLRKNSPNPLSEPVNTIDLGFVVDALKNFRYPQSGPCTCLPDVNCDDACVAGTPNACNGGACVNGYCLDVCDRCFANP